MAAEATTGDFETFRAMACGEEGWTAVTEKSGVRVSSRKAEGSSLNISRGIAVLDAPVAAVRALVTSAEQRTAWDKLIAECRVFATDGPATHVLLRSIPYTFPPVSARVFYVEMRVDEDPATGTVTILARQSTREDLPAPPKGAVVGKVMSSGFVLEKVGEDKTRIYYVIQLDLAGWIPNAIVNKAMADEPLCLDNMRKLLQQK